MEVSRDVVVKSDVFEQIALHELILARDGKGVFIGSGLPETRRPSHVEFLSLKNTGLSQRVTQIAHWQGLVGAPFACFWCNEAEGNNAKDNDTAGMEISILGAGPPHRVRIPSDPPISNIVAANWSRGFVVERIEKPIEGKGGDNVERLRLWDIETAELLQEFETVSSVAAVALSPDGRYLAAAGLPLQTSQPSEQPPNSKSAILTVWDTTTGEFVFARNMGYYVWNVQFSPSGDKLLCSGIADQFVAGKGVGYTDVITLSRPGWSWRYENETENWHPAAFYDENRVVVEGTASQVFLLDLRRSEVLTTLDTKQEGVAAFLIHDGFLLTGGFDGTLCRWRLEER
ncbi:WD40 repeat domain-containing protein, partial [Bremerella cremea]